MSRWWILAFLSCLFVSSCEGWSTFSRFSNTIVRRQCESRAGTALMMSTPQRDRRPQAPPPPINQFIKADKVRLIVPGNNTGEDVMMGIYSLSDALKEAETYELDLVMINDKADPPVCKIIDYGKYKYAMEKKKKENAKKQVNVDIKEVKMSYKIDQHDFDVRLRAVKKFLADGDKVKIIVQFRGREMQFKDLGRDLLQKIYTPIEDVASMESTPKVEGKSLTMLVGPKKTS